MKTKLNINQAISVRRMRESDAYTIENFTDGKTLMYSAALGIRSYLGENPGRVAIVSGSGNNGGDGYALALILAKDGIYAGIYRTGSRFSGDGKHFYDLAMEYNLCDSLIDDDTDLTGYDTVVDCIFGTGFKGEPKGADAVAINKINSSGAKVISADINSGVNGDTGEAVLAVKSDITVSIGYPKTGMFLNDAPSLTGELVNVDIGIKLI